jgi:hypothetical protein
MKLTCLLLFLAVGGSYAARGLDSYASGDAIAAAGRSLLQTCNRVEAWGPCKVLPTTPAGVCPSCKQGWQSAKGRKIVNGKPQECTVYQDCTVAVVNSGDNSASAGSSQSGSISASTTQVVGTTGTGTSSNNVQAVGTATLNVDASGLVNTWTTVYNNDGNCANGLSDAVISDALVAYVQSCANAYSKCATTANTQGAAYSYASCAVTTKVAQDALVEALVSSAKAFIRTTCATAEAEIDRAFVSAYITSEFTLQVWTKVAAFPKGGSAYAVSTADVSTFLSAFQQLNIKLFAKTCACKPSCQGYCKVTPPADCGAGGCTNPPPNTGVTINGNTGAVGINYPYYQGTITSLFANAWVTAYNKGCGQYTDVQVWANAFGKAVAYIMADFDGFVVATGNAYATAGYNFDAFATAVTSIMADFKASAKVGGCTGVTGCDSCVATASSTAVDSLSSTGFANAVINECKRIWALGGTGHTVDYYADKFASPLAADTDFAFTEVIQKLNAKVGSDCLCGVTAPVEVVNNNP